MSALKTLGYYIRHAAYVYSAGLAACAFVTMAWEAWTSHGWYTGGEARHVVSVDESVAIVIWLLCTVYTGWEAFNRGSAK